MKKKEALQADKDAYDWEKTVKEKEKNISTLQKQLAALSTDSSASANAKRRQLQAELNEAMQDLNDTYYDHSIETQQDSLDKELESFEQNKQDEMDTLDKWLEDQDAVIKESFDLVKENASTVLGEINDVAQEYGIQISDAIVSPWEAGTNAVYGYQDAFNSTIGDLSASADAFIGKLNGIKEAQEALANKNSNPEQIIEEQKKVFEGIGSDYNAGYVGMSQEDFDALKAAETAWWAAKAAGDKEAMNAAHAAAEAIRSGYGYSGGGDGSEFIVNGNHSNYSGSNASDSTSQYNAGQVGMSRDDYNTIEEAKKEWAAAKAAGDEAGMKAAHEKAEAVRDEYGYSGGGDGSEYIEKKKKYAKGITSTSKDAWAIIDELGDELVLHAGENGKLAYLTKGTGVVPHNLTERLMDLALDPTSVLESSKPNIGAPQITTNNMNIDLSFGSLVHVDSCNQDTIPQLQKMVQTEVNNMVKGLNQGLKRFVR